jgi:hypothetical protein
LKNIHIFVSQALFMIAKEIIPPVPKELLEQELTEDKFVRKTNFGGNLLYIVTHNDSPNLMREIGRLREESFRFGGGGTGADVDIDEFDTSDDPYNQLIVWDPQHRQILGGYRFYIPNKGASGESIAKRLSTSHLFNYSEKFKNLYMPNMIELGRSFVHPAYQSTNRVRKGIYALDNLWDGLGAIMIHNPDMRYFFGKITMYTHFNKIARNLILYFLKKNFGDRENLVTPIEPIDMEWDETELEAAFNGENYLENYKILSKKVRSHHENIPPLFNAYMNLSPSMKSFGTSVNHEFGDVEETGILITIADLYQAKVERHVSTYKRVRYFLRKDKMF